MPTPDPTFQHSDEDWTQITQPRLRKRVQNRVSQRKHRNKVRQQRANSIDAGNTASAPVNAPGHWPPSSALSSNDPSSVGKQQNSQRVRGSPKQPHLDTNLGPERSGFDGFDPNLLDGCAPWTGSPSSLYPQSSAYPTVSPYLSSDPSHLANTFVTTSDGSSKEPSIPASASPPMYYNAHDGVGTSPYDYLQYLHQWYIPQTSIAPISYTARETSAGPSPLEHPQHHPIDVMQPRLMCENWPLARPSTLPVSKPADLNTNGYYHSSHAPTMAGNVEDRNISLPVHSMKSSSSSYPADRNTTTLGEGIEPRGSGINPTHYKGGKQPHPSAWSKR
ncbi:MAG: hypothetical protein Q9216_005251 [Gyalolechia sp. 2 TL-2023]